MKKLHYSIVYVVLLSLFIGSAILISKPVEKSTDSKGSINVDKNNDYINAYKNEVLGNNLVKKEIIKVSNNEKGIDLHATLVENINGQVSLNLAYKLNGKKITKNIEASNVAEIRNIFRFREKSGTGYKLKNMLLNKEMGKLYFIVEGKQIEKYTQTAIYSYGLKNSKIEKIFYDLGNFSDFSVSPDGKYNAFSYLDCPQKNANEKNIVVIIRCSDNKLVLNTNEDIIKKQIDKSNYIYMYSYDFIKWKSNSICELNQRIKAKDGLQKEKKQTVYLNVVSNQLSDKI